MTGIESKCGQEADNEKPKPGPIFGCLSIPPVKAEGVQRDSHGRIVLMRTAR